MRLVRTLAIAVFAVAVALTPLSAVTAGGHFEYRYAPTDSWDWLGHNVVVRDRTGLVAAIGPSQPKGAEVSNVARSGNLLLVEWLAGGCDTYSQLLFERQETGYVIHVTSGGRRCSLLDLRGYAAVLKLWSPVYAENVSLETRFDQ